MSVLDRAALEDSPLADLHAVASELSIDGYRRLRRAELIEAILDVQGGAEPAGEQGPETRSEEPAPSEGPAPPEEDEASSEDEASATRRRRGRRGGRGRGAVRDEAPASADVEPEEEALAPAHDADAEAPEVEPSRRERPGQPEDEVVEGAVELLPSGSGFLRVQPPDPSDEDVYISAAQVKRCELVSGDRISGPRRRPRRSERFPSLVRIDTINGRPAAEVAEGTRFDDLPAAFPAERLRLGSEDPTVKAIEWLTPFGKGSRVTITGPARAGKSEALRRLATAIVDQDSLQVSVALAGVRPEELSDWSSGPIEPSAAVSFAASADAQAAAIERVIDQARRIAARGGDAVVLIDTLEGLHPPAARKVLAAARNIVDGGSLTVVATAAKPFGGETTVIALDAGLASTGRFPALDLVASGTIRPELLVGEAGAEAIARARAEAVDE